MAVKKRRERTCIPAAHLYDSRRRSIRINNVPPSDIDDVPSQLSRLPTHALTRLAIRSWRANQTFPLLKLPPELRLQVHQEIQVVDPLRAGPNSAGTLMSSSGMIYVNRQVGMEFIKEMHRTAPVTMVVVDFDFSHVVETLKRFSPGEFKTLRKVEQLLEKDRKDAYGGDDIGLQTPDPSPKKGKRFAEKGDLRAFRTLTLELKITQKPDENSKDLGTGLKDWLKCFDREKPESWSDVDFLYTIIDSAKPELGADAVTLDLEHWEEKLEKHEKETNWIGEGRALLEVKKIHKAITEYCNEWDEKLR